MAVVEVRRRMSRAMVRSAAVIAAAAMLATGAAASIYVDAKLTELKPEERVAITNPRPVQLLTEFQTNGATNAKATKYAAPIIGEEVKSSGFASAVSDTPLPDGARLSIVINDVPSKSNKGNGFAAGFTFGLAGVVAGDDYETTATYTPAGGGAPIVKVEHYRIIFKFGNKELPPDVIKVKGITEASKMMIHLTVTHVLNDIAADPGFASGTAPGQPEPTPTPAAS
ncbi:MAG: hypothetical protein WC804_01545 [Sphingomonas sp.]|jgi:hypothetical protein|uniref:hypothetical protein n=1 Tax=Sphingomonas sp. TaxID=28214 RepID=UPI003566628E